MRSLLPAYLICSHGQRLIVGMWLGLAQEVVF